MLRNHSVYLPSSRPLYFILVVILAFALLIPKVNARQVMMTPIESIDLTLQPNASLEHIRVQYLEQSFVANVQGSDLISDEIWRNLNAGVGYLWDRPELLFPMAQQHDARWILVTRLYKPSHLFSYFEFKAYDVHSQLLLGEESIEIKGITPKLLEKAAKRAANIINTRLNNDYP